MQRSYYHVEIIHGRVTSNSKYYYKCTFTFLPFIGDFKYFKIDVKLQIIDLQAFCAVGKVSWGVDT